MPPVCKKCGGKIDPRGNYCMECLQTVHTVDNQDPIEERKLPVKAIAIAGGALLFIILICIFIATRPLPPERVAEEWLNKLLSYRLQDAVNYTTPQFEQSNGFIDQRGASYDRADEFKDMVDNEDAKYVISKPKYSKAGKKQMASVDLTFTKGNGEVLIYDLVMVRQKSGHWKIDRAE
jgi:hypothetical protein